MCVCACACVCFEALSLFFFKPVTHVLLKGLSPDAGREAAGRGRAGVLHEKQPICKRVLAGYCCRINWCPMVAFFALKCATTELDSIYVITLFFCLFCFTTKTNTTFS